MFCDSDYAGILGYADVMYSKAAIWLGRFCLILRTPQ